MLALRALHVPQATGRPAPALNAGQRNGTVQPYRRRCSPVSAVYSPTPSAVASPTDTSETLTARVAEKERQLQAMFEPGKLQPKAGEVAALRREIATLRGQLQTQLGIATYTPSRGAGPASGGSIMDAPLAGAASASSATTSSAQKRMLDALRLAEAQMAASRLGPGGQSALSLAEQQELLRLQDENVALKNQLDLVQARHSQLLQLAEQHFGSSRRSSGVHAAASINSNSASVPAYGTAAQQQEHATAAP